MTLLKDLRFVKNTRGSFFINDGQFLSSKLMETEPWRPETSNWML